MLILLVSATFLEIEPFCTAYKIPVTEHSKPDFVSFNWFGLQIDLLITGPGINNTAYFMGKHCSKKNYQLAINIGICGAFDAQLNIGEIVVVTKDTFSDFGAEDDSKFLSAFELQFIKKNDFPFSGNWLQLKDTPLINLSMYKKVKGITVNTVHGNAASIAQVMGTHQPQVETMESAAFIFACLLEDIPAIELRGVSNRVEKRNKENWNIPLAVEQLNHQLITVLNQIKPC